ncbi:MAG: GrpB family protein [Chthoniobacteraceae bacterium]
MDEILIGGIEKRKLVIVDYDPCWPAKFQRHSEILSLALGTKALAIEHVGSTSVPGLAAKPIIDILLLVADPANEAAYLPALVEAGYVLRVREPDWHQHRMFRTPELDVHIHIFAPDCVEVTRQLAFRDRLKANAEDLRLYESMKRKLVEADWPDMNAYAQAKTEVVEQITARALQEAGLFF